MGKGDFDRIKLTPIGFVTRTSPDEDVKDKSLVSRIVLRKDLTKALDGIEDFSHILVIYWLHKVKVAEKPVLHHPSKRRESEPLGIFATRAPIRPNPVGLTLVELVSREENALVVKGLDALDGTPVLDIKPYPDWEQGRPIIVTDFKVPKWLTRTDDQHL